MTDTSGMNGRTRASGRLASQELAQIRQGQREGKIRGPKPSFACAANVDPLIKEFFARAEALRVNKSALIKRVGTNGQIFYSWQRGESGANLLMFKAAVEALGGKLEIVWAELGTDATESEALDPNGPALQDKAPTPARSPLPHPATSIRVNPMAPQRGPSGIPK